MRGYYAMRLMIGSALLLPMAVLAQRGGTAQAPKTTMSKATSPYPAFARSAPASNSQHVKTMVPNKGHRPPGPIAADRQGGPANDDCAGATTLTMSATCTPLSVNNTGATQSVAASTCSGATGDADDDVWFQFVATAASATIVVDGAAQFDAVVELRSGACNGTSVSCADVTLDGGVEQIVAPGLSVGVTYYVRVYDYFTGAAPTPEFTICVFGTPPPPANDNCAGAVLLGVNTSCQSVVGNVANATQSLPAILCSTFTGDANDDVWFRFVATAANLTVRVAGSDSLDAVVELLSGSCGATVNVGCADVTLIGGVEVISATGLQVGQTYYVRVYHYYSAIPATTSFDICVFGGGNPPANDQCFNVVPLALNVGGQLTFTGNNVGSTSTNDAVGGSALDVTGDTTTVWHAFTTTTCANVTLSYCTTTPPFGTVWVVLTQTCPANQIILATTTEFTTCASGNATITFANLPAGTYYVPVYGDASTQGAYSIIATATACGGGNPPPNDQCFNAVPGALNVGGQLTFTGTNVGATSTNDAVVGSGLDVAPDTTTVWHAFTTTTCANVTLSYCGTTPEFATVWVVLAQTCPADQLVFATAADFVTCVDSNATILFASLPAGTYYVPVFGNANNQGNYTILATATACGSAPANDDCTNVTALPVWTPAECPANATAGNNALATQDGGTPSCDSTGVGTELLDVWYIFNSGPYSTITVNFDEGTMTDWVVVVSDGCSGAELACAITPTAPIVLTVTTFTSYTVRVYSNTDFGVGGDFTICLTGDLGTGVQLTEGLSWSLYPNPTNGVVNLIWADASTMATVDLLDATGRLVRQQRQMLHQGTNVLIGADAALLPGAYMVRVTTRSASTEQRVIVR
ncbi:MAG: T9SS type A sorting domain-containing protein [Flavobacteriales bacterium]|jgi:hypothetical protein|nr:T9SS type A sorting domain-containing protein [Flavobacteriales bacterium]MBK7268826.1 T9SS type A sorting domain-containing protein [Flavobacteriales bacterium]MBK7752142.1 T9SS type A sorting domain-containing protein [Flavobacteriales bacterium]MBK9537915.1 T9SS type A sorting domain-containing protein [Flavobacteriales bacterium]